MDIVRKITEKNQHRFFAKCYKGEVFKYSQIFFVKDLIKMAAAEGVIIEYCPPTTIEYIQHGCFTCKVIGGKVFYEKPIETKIVDGIGEIAERSKAGEKLSIFDLANIMLGHLGNDAKNITFSKTEKVTLQ